MYIAAGDKKTKLLDLHKVRREFDRMVLSNPEIVTEVDEWREVFGLRHG
jgi:hypothetical protein